MNFLMSMSHHAVRLFALAALVAVAAQNAVAQPENEPEALKAAHEQLVEALDGVDDLFYKQKTAENGTIFYTVMWESGGETTKIILGLKNLGYFNNEYIYALSAWTYVASSENAMPPAVIKAVTTANESLMIGNYSCSADFKNVYANMTGVLKNVTPDEMWMYMAYLHSNRLKLKQQVDQAMAGAGG